MQVVWLIISLKIMKRSLFYRYLKCRKLMIVASTMSIIYFALHLIPNSAGISMFFNVKMNILRYVYQNFKQQGYDYTPTTFVLVIIADLILNIYLPIFVLFNTKFIEFKVYLSDILIGRRLEKE